ncbi:MAG: hypothetical protein EOM70_03805 [Clostridia bacterium]|nr:hypothetical protein [Clostridia bacterium]
MLPGLTLVSAIQLSLSIALIRDLLWGLVFFLVAILLLRALYEPTQLEVTRQILLTAKPDNGSSKAPHEGIVPDLIPDNEPGQDMPAPSGLRIALISDLHAEWLRLRPERIAQALAAEDVDLLLFAGDLTGRHHRPELAKPWLDALTVICQRMGNACYAVPGNHDSPASLNLLRQAGFTMLINESREVRERSGRDWLLVGLDILKKGQPDFELAVRNASSPGADSRATIPPERRLVLAHNPDTFFLVPPGQAGFFLAGHFHGGQIYLPFHLEFFLLRREKLGRMGYHKGSFALNGMSGYISRGLGSVLFPLRLGSIPELPILELRPDTQSSAVPKKVEQ